MAKAIVELLGRRCEVVIHDFPDRPALDHTIVAVEDNLAGLESASPQPLASAAHTPDQQTAEGVDRSAEIIKVVTEAYVVAEKASCRSRQPPLAGRGQSVALEQDLALEELEVGTLSARGG